MKTLDWNKLSDKNKKEISKLKPIFFCGPVEMSEKRILKLISQLSSKKHLLFGILKEEFIPGLEKSLQFKALKSKDLELATAKLQTQNPSLTILEYYQRDWDYILKELDLSAVILVNGSWYRQIHLKKELWTIIDKKIPYKFVSRFEDEHEAKNYLKEFENSKFKFPNLDKTEDIFNFVEEVSKKSFDWTFQTGAVLVKNKEVILTSYNKVVPYETFAMHFGSSREKNFTPPNDQNYYDTNHAEVELLIKAANQKIDLSDSTLYINLLPCPACARMLSQTNIKKIVYKLDHSDGYAFKLLTESGKIVTRIA